MTNDEVKKAFMNEEPVIYALPKSEPIKCDRIYALVYKRFGDGKIHMSVQVQDSRMENENLIFKELFIYLVLFLISILRK